MRMRPRMEGCRWLSSCKAPPLSLIFVCSAHDVRPHAIAEWLAQASTILDQEEQTLGRARLLHLPPQRLQSSDRRGED